jgi:hypothetical protein
MTDPEHDKYDAFDFGEGLNHGPRQPDEDRTTWPTYTTEQEQSDAARPTEANSYETSASDEQR